MYTYSNVLIKNTGEKVLDSSCKRVNFGWFFGLWCLQQAVKLHYNSTGQNMLQKSQFNACGYYSARNFVKLNISFLSSSETEVKHKLKQKCRDKTIADDKYLKHDTLK